MKKHVKLLLALLILGITFIAFTRYAHTHPGLFDTLRQTNPVILALLIGCYIVWFLALVIILRISLRMYGVIIPRQENLLLNTYSTLVNFFGPGQSGPALRGLYLKKRHGLAIKKYLFATLLYYGFYAVCSAFLLLVGSQAWWVTALAVTGVAAISLAIVRLYARRSRINTRPGITPTLLGWLALATASQVGIQAVIFFIELRQVDANVTVAQALAYTGTANFALFASVTPGAIGIREAFLVITQNIHAIGSAAIVAANVIDRAVYLVFLGILFILAISLHAKDKLRIKQYLGKTDESR